MAGQITLIRLTERSEPRDNGEGDIPPEETEVEVEVIEGGEEVGGVQAGGDPVLEVVVFARVGVGEVADVAGEGGFVEKVVEAGALGRVVGVGGLGGRVAGFDGGIDAARFGVGGEDGVDIGGEFGVGLDVRGKEEVGFVGDVGEDEGGGEFVEVSCGGGKLVGG